MGSLRVGHDWATSLSLFTFMHWRRKWQPTHSCLENPRDRGAWWAAIYGVAQSRTRLKRLSSSRANPWGSIGQNFQSLRLKSKQRKIQSQWPKPSDLVAPTSNEGSSPSSFLTIPWLKASSNAGDSTQAPTPTPSPIPTRPHLSGS